MAVDLSVTIGKLRLRNPVMVASGTFGYAEEFADFCDLKKLGAIVSKTITIKPRQGNPLPRTCETPSGMLNSIGLENPGLEKFLKEKMPVLKKAGAPIIVSIASEADPDEFVFLAQTLDRVSGVAAIELNISCPNIKKVAGSPGRQVTRLVAQDCKATSRVVKAVRKVTSKTLITKLSPNVTDIVEIARSAEDAGSDALALINTLMGMSIDIKTRCPRIAMGVAGLSGPAIRPVAIRMVWEVYQKVRIPIIGMGGIVDIKSALEFFIAGASAVSVGTQNFIDPGISVGIVNGLREYLQDHGLRNVKSLVTSR